MVTVPDRFVEPVGEAQGQDVVDRLLAEEVVDAKDVGLVETLGDGGVERSRRREVDPEGLLADDLRVLIESGGPQHLNDAEDARRRHREVEQSLDLTAHLLFGARDGVDEFARAVLFGVGEGEVLLELLPLRAFGLVRTELAHRVVRRACGTLCPRAPTPYASSR